MATAQSKLDILIEAKNNASGTLKQTKSELEGLDKSAGLAAKGIMGLATAAGVAGIAALASMTMELGRAGAEAERLGTSFDGLARRAGQSAATMLSAMDDAAMGTISNTDLMLAANRAMLLGVADSAEEMTQLLEVASARGKAMGMSTAAAFGDIITGIGRMSPMILDNLGIVVDQAAANEVYADSLGKTAEKLSDAEKKQALLNAVISSSTALVRENEAAGRDAAANFERMDAAITNARDALAHLFEPAMVVVAQAIADAADAAADAMEHAAATNLNATVGQVEGLRLSMRLLADNAAYLEGNMVELERAGQKNSASYQGYATQLGEVNAKISQTKAQIDSLIPSIQLANQDFEQTAMTAQQARVALGLVGDAADTTGSKLRAMGADALAAMDAFNVAMGLSNEIAGSIESAAASSGALFAGKQGGDAGLARQQQVTSELKAQQKLWEDQGYTQQQIADVLMPGYVSQLREADSATFRVATGTAKISDEARAAQQAFEDLKGTVAGVLQGALDPGVGVNPDDVLEKLGLPREDAINESARRLADIAQNGLKGQDWLGDFANDVPDIWRMIRTAQNPQEEAAYLLRDFQDGLLTAAIDKDKAKAIVKRQILGDQNMAAMAQEIATELAAEMGVPMQQALAAAQGALGGGGTLGVGGDAAQGFTDGANANLDETNAGGTFVDKFIAQARASYASLKTAGADGGKQWGDGFMATVGENVPPALISLLTNLVTPGVMAQFAQRGTLTGATP